MWLEKKSQSNMGRGIKLIGDVVKYREELLERRSHDAFGKNNTSVPSDSTDILLQKLE